MRRTIFDTPVLTPLLHWLARLIIKLSGWQVESKLPDLDKLVVIGAPHTSNWDFIVMLVLMFYYPIKVFWMGKDSAFRWPLDGLFHRLGGIAIDRSKTNSIVSRAVQVFDEVDQLVLVVPPEGTRKKVSRWKTGFYYIALGAGVPIVMAFADFERKVAGFGPTFTPTGDIDADMLVVREFYKEIKGKNTGGWDETAIAARENAS